ncbi:methionine aminotransferase [Chryseosolibacter indicus]|uniref:Aminotransferase class I/II-fold pyridoxal phosphate-dependent enzyme n=1 Tax=Chryseosolibacter indicus TaxID=2782351 RepID=A0ABS5VNL8_9BACT|nr:methionine aminotransferase [Chryseosolibacter indicus]MBT1703018.1 aminotransferase class I/II-fold pyridoxal phosphate-dependent enzyme [Chryseosolibacter indicus]
MVSVQSRLPDVGTSIFSVMSKMALEHGAINLSQGFPDFSIDEKIIQLVNKYMLQGNNQYAPMPGSPSLRERIASVIFKTYKVKVDLETDVTVTAGATEGLFSVIAAFVGSGDEVIVFDTAYDSYDPSIRLNGGVPVHIDLNYPDFSIDWDRVRNKITKRTRAIIINTPHNPTGTVLKEADLIELEKIVLEHNILVISDEVYERLIYDNTKHQSVLTRPALAGHSLAVFSFGKTFHATGWKCGYVIAPAYLSKEVRRAHQFIVFSVNTPVQMALAEYMNEEGHYLHLGKFYQEKRDFFLQQIKGSSFEPLPSYGSYFQLLSYKNISQKGDVEMAEELTKKFKVASIPVSVFYKNETDNKLLRFCFAKKESTLEKAATILRSI